MQGRDLRPDISIHALRKEGDGVTLGVTLGVTRFLSTPSARRATDLVWQLYHRTEISIHALRKEGDQKPDQGDGEAKIFLSTPSARRATMT